MEPTGARGHGVWLRHVVSLGFTLSMTETFLQHSRGGCHTLWHRWPAPPPRSRALRHGLMAWRCLHCLISFLTFFSLLLHFSNIQVKLNEMMKFLCVSVLDYLVALHSVRECFSGASSTSAAGQLLRADSQDPSGRCCVRCMPPSPASAPHTSLLRLWVK